jgi:hypothetical protein
MRRISDRRAREPAEGSRRRIANFNVAAENWTPAGSMIDIGDFDGVGCETFHQPVRLRCVIEAAGRGQAQYPRGGST